MILLKELWATVLAFLRMIDWWVAMQLFLIVVLGFLILLGLMHWVL